MPISTFLVIVGKGQRVVRETVVADTPTKASTEALRRRPGGHVKKVIELHPGPPR